MFDSTKYSGTCKAPFLLKDETHCISRLSSSETASTTLDITRGTKSLEMVNTWFLWKENHEHNSYNRNVFYNNISVKSIDWKDHFIVINGQNILEQLEYDGFLLMLPSALTNHLLIATLVIWYVTTTTFLQCLKAAGLQNVFSADGCRYSGDCTQTAVL